MNYAVLHHKQISFFTIAINESDVSGVGMWTTELKLCQYGSPGEGGYNSAWNSTHFLLLYLLRVFEVNSGITPKLNRAGTTAHAVVSQ